MDKKQIYTLRQATYSDLPFLFKASTEAMRPVSEIIHQGETIDETKRFEEYAEKFNPEKIQVIQHDGKDAGRLRVVRTEESIYVGGIQLLPEFQGKGIGGALFGDLIEEAKATNIPITLEVHDVNERAKSFYTRLGFVESGKEEHKTLMIYKPS